MSDPAPDPARRIPPGQVLTDKWPVLHASYIPRFDPKTWDFRIWGLVEQPAVDGPPAERDHDGVNLRRRNHHLHVFRRILIPGPA